MHSYSQLLKDKLVQAADADKSVTMKGYMKNQFAFLGIPTPERRKICIDYAKQNTIKNEQELEAIVKELWILPQREFQYCAIETLLYNKKLWQQKIIEIIEYCLTNKSWWDTVDPLSYDCTGNYFKMFPEKINSITLRWNHSENIWLQRSSLLFQKSYKNNTDTGLLAAYILNIATSKEFFVQKAIGWILREYAKTDVAWVKAFVHEHKLAPLSQREAMKHL